MEPVPGYNLTVSLDVNIQKYAEQAAYQVTWRRKGANAVSVIIMDPEKRRDPGHGERPRI